MAASAATRPGSRKAHRVVFVTGKGGVGKSVVAAATALQLARGGQRVLLVELGSRSFLGRLLDMPVGNEPLRWRPRVSIARWDVESSLREYLGHYLLFKVAADKLLNNTLMKALVAAAPGLAELALLGRLMAPMQHAWYRRDVDVVVVDGYATGQFMAMLRAPRGLAQSATAGPMHSQSLALVGLLSNAEICEYRLVTLAEDLPIAEACEMAAGILAETGIAAKLVCNRMLDIPAALPVLPDTHPGAAFVAAMSRTVARQQAGLAALEGLGEQRAGPVCRLPFVATRDAMPLLEALADVLEEAAAGATSC